MKRAGAVGIALAVAAFAAWHFTRNDEQSAAFRSRRAAARTMAEYLARKFPGPRVVVISNPFTQFGASPDTIKMEQAGIEGLREGFGKKATVKVVVPELKPAARSDPRSLLVDPTTPNPLSYLVIEDSFDKLATDCDVVVSLIGLPAALDRVQCWQKAGKPAFALLLPDLRIIGDVRAPLKTGKLAAFAMLKPKTKDEFLLVTPENVDDLGGQYPGLLTPD